jgi:hypothetical protein
MSTFEGAQLAQIIRAKTEEMKKVCEAMTEETASEAPQGRWSPKQIISHISGPDGIGLMPAITLILEQDIPRVDLVAEDPFFTDRRSRLSMTDLLSEFEQEYHRIADFLANASEDQLRRKAHIPLFKDTPLGEYPTLAAFIGALGEWHMEFHLNHMKEVLQALANA